MLPSDCGTPTTFTSFPAVRLLAIAAWPAAVVRSIGLTVMMLLVRSIWYTRVTEPDTLEALTVTALVPPETVMAKLPPLLVADQAVDTVPSGTGVGSMMVATAAQAVPFQLLGLNPTTFNWGTVSPKLAAPFTVETKLGMAL